MQADELARGHFDNCERGSPDTRIQLRGYIKSINGSVQGFYNCSSLLDDSSTVDERLRFYGLVAMKSGTQIADRKQATGYLEEHRKLDSKLRAATEALDTIDPTLSKCIETVVIGSKSSLDWESRTLTTTPQVVNSSNAWCAASLAYNAVMAKSYNEQAGIDRTRLSDAQWRGEVRQDALDTMHDVLVRAGGTEKEISYLKKMIESSIPPDRAKPPKLPLEESPLIEELKELFALESPERRIFSAPY